MITMTSEETLLVFVFAETVPQDSLVSSADRAQNVLNYRFKMFVEKLGKQFGRIPVKMSKSLAKTIPPVERNTEGHKY